MDAMFPIPEKEGNQRNTILIASTFTKKLSLAFDEELFNKIKILSEKGTFKFMQILHPKLPDDIKSKWKSLQGENFQYHDTTDIIPLMHQADIMLSDTSSVIQEFLLQRKPVVTFRHNIPQDHIINVNEVSKIEDKSYLKNKPINFARKWKVRRKLGYFTFKSFVRPFTLPKNKEI